jgi:hypothetical protein
MVGRMGSDVCKRPVGILRHHLGELLGPMHRSTFPAGIQALSLDSNKLDSLYAFDNLYQVCSQFLMTYESPVLSPNTADCFLDHWPHVEQVQCGYTATPGYRGLQADCLTVGLDQISHIDA